MSAYDFILKPCDCLEPGFCPHFKRQLVGRLWQLSRMEGQLGIKYRQLWAQEAGVLPPMPKKKCNCGHKAAARKALGWK